VVDLLKLNDVEFHLEFEKAAELDQATTNSILHFINDCERRKSYLDLGYSSIYDYCVRKLGYSSSTAGRYIQAARCIRANPEVLRMLEARDVSVTSICQFASILDDENKESVLGRVKGASWRDVELVAREYRPPVELRDRMMPVRAVTHDGVENMVFVQFLARDEYAAVFDDVRNLMPREMTYGDVCLAVFGEYLDRHSPIARQKRRDAKKGVASLDSHQRESSLKKRSTGLHSHQWESEAGKRAGGLHSHRQESNATSHHIPDVVRDVILIRDGGQCAFVAPDGTRCQCRKDLQVDHIKPFANHGPIDMSNLRLLCGGHNRLMAERAMGRHVMQPYWRQA